MFSVVKSSVTIVWLSTSDCTLEEGKSVMVEVGVIVSSPAGMIS